MTVITDTALFNPIFHQSIRQHVVSIGRLSPVADSASDHVSAVIDRTAVFYHPLRDIPQAPMASASGASSP